jgi:hypothetical protein
MGIIISMLGERQPVDALAPIVVRIECDDAGEIFCRGYQDFISRNGLIGAQDMARTEGWSNRKNGAYRWVCPKCSSKMP